MTIEVEIAMAIGSAVVSIATAWGMLRGSVASIERRLDALEAHDISAALAELRAEIRSLHALIEREMTR